MAEPNPLERETHDSDAEPSKPDAPAVGLVVTDENNSVVGEAIVDALRHDLHVLVTANGSESEAMEFAEHLPVTVVDSDQSTAESHPRDRLISAARNREFPGLIHHAVPSQPVDYEQSVTESQQSSQYCVSAVPAPNVSEGSSVVAGIPAYNEAVAIGSVVLRAKEYSDEVLVIDDGSTDDTARIAEAAGATVLEHDENRGKGAAIRTLLDYVNPDRCDAVVLLDGDGQHVPDDIPEVIHPVLDDGADLVIGSRYLDGTDSETPRYRRIGQRVLDFSTNFLDLLTNGKSRTQVNDSQSGFRALSPAAIEQISLTTDHFGVESEMIDSASRQGLEIREKPIEVQYDGIDGQTQNPFRHGLAIVVFILKLIRDRHPLLFFGMPGLFLTVIGVMYGMDSILIYQTTGRFYPAKALVSGFVTIIGVLGVFTGLVLNQIANIVAQAEGEL